MTDQPVLGQVVLGCSPIADRHRAITPARLTVFPSLAELVRAIESESVFDIRGAADATMLGLPEASRSVLRALAGARQLDRRIRATVACDR